MEVCIELVNLPLEQTDLGLCNLLQEILSVDFRQMSSVCFLLITHVEYH